jgi:hypothetical protein
MGPEGGAMGCPLGAVRRMLRALRPKISAAWIQVSRPASACTMTSRTFMARSTRKAAPPLLRLSDVARIGRVLVARSCRHQMGEVSNLPSVVADNTGSNPHREAPVGLLCCSTYLRST